MTDKTNTKRTAYVAHLDPKIHAALTAAAERLSKTTGRRITVKQLISEMSVALAASIPELKDIPVTSLILEGKTVLLGIAGDKPRATFY